jgi:hypothetical protein
MQMGFFLGYGLLGDPRSANFFAPGRQLRMCEVMRFSWSARFELRRSEFFDN